VKKFIECAGKLNQADICHIQHEYFFWGGFRPLRNFFPYFISSIKIPVVITAHELLNPPFRMADFSGTMKWLALCLAPLSRRYSDYINAGMFQRADCTIVHTRQQREFLIQQGVSPDKISIIPHGIAPCRLPENQTDVLRRFDVEGKRFLTIIGFISPRKGYGLVLEILAHLPNDVILVIAGGFRTEQDAEYGNILRTLIEKYCVNERVIITGYVKPDELHTIVSASSIVLAPFSSISGSGSLSIAFALGKPVIASNLDSVAEINESSKSILLFENGNSRDLLDKIILLLTDKILSEKLGAAALHYAAKNSMYLIAEQTIALYKFILKSRLQISNL
jgi:glycosyltransferase involved in cell wall biosynthesis